MGYYIIQGPVTGKVRYLIETHGAREVDRAAARAAIHSEDEAPVIVVMNGPFDAAGFAFSEQEFNDFMAPSDPRPKRFLLMPRDLVVRLSGFQGEE